MTAMFLDPTTTYDIFDADHRARIRVCELRSAFAGSTARSMRGRPRRVPWRPSRIH
jgi:hypothetical protein